MTVTLYDLKQYQNNKLLEREYLDELDNLNNTYKSPALASDGSGKTLSVNSPVERAMAQKARKEEKLKIVQGKIAACDDFIDSITDAQVRMICVDRFIHGYTWEATCLHLRKHRSTGTVIRMVNSYFERNGLQ